MDRESSNNSVERNITQNARFLEIERRVSKLSHTEYDAVHPRFQKPNEAADVAYEEKNHYYCEQCKMFFAPTDDGLKMHFQKEIKTHRPYKDPCVYCNGKVYEYVINGESRVFHNCATD